MGSKIEYYEEIDLPRDESSKVVGNFVDLVMESLSPLRTSVDGNSRARRWLG